MSDNVQWSCHIFAQVTVSNSFQFAVESTKDLDFTRSDKKMTPFEEILK
jgi:hypothetical protein